MRKVSIILLCGIILFGVCGCNDSNNNNSDNNETRNVITKEELSGTWKFYGDIFTFKSDGTYTRDETITGTYEIIGNWLILDDDISIYYEYIDGKLYTTDNGSIMEKQ